MAVASLSDHFKHYGLAWTLALSALLHAFLVSTMPPFRMASPAPKPPLQVQLVLPQPEPQPTKDVAPPEPPKPEPPKPKPEPKPEPPLRRPAPKVAVDEPPVRMSEPKPAEPARTEPSPPPVIAAAPKAEEPPPAFTAPPPPPEPPKPSGPTEADLDSARQAYGNSLSREIGKNKRYPRIAQMRGWQGSVRLLLEIDASGKVTSVKVEEASDREVFNAEALDMVKRMVQPPPVPDALRGRSFSVRVPIAFRLE